MKPEGGPRNPASVTTMGRQPWGKTVQTHSADWRAAVRIGQAKDLHVLSASRPTRARLHQPAKGVERLGQCPPGQRRRLVQRAELCSSSGR